MRLSGSATTSPVERGCIPSACRVPASGDSDVQGYGHYGDGHYGGGHYGSHGSGPYRKRKKGGFLSELFD